MSDSVDVAAEFSALRSDQEYAKAVKVIKILIRNKIIPKESHEESYMRTYQAAFEILDLFK